MQDKKRRHPKVKSKLHPRNIHRNRYDFPTLIGAFPDLKPFVRPNKYGDLSIDFFDPKAVRMLNAALLKHHYHITEWDIPEGYLCPPIPGRADYIHHIGELLGKQNGRRVPEGKQVVCLDIGVGASCIYPIIGVRSYHWNFIGSETDPVALASARKIVAGNVTLSRKVELREQTNSNAFFEGILQPDEKIDLSICNPPFHQSAAAARAASARKESNLKKKVIKTPKMNFGGQANELWCPGGEEKFIGDMIRESARFGKSCCWFSSLVSKYTTLPSCYEALRSVKAEKVRTIEMGQGQKASRILAWTFQDNDARAEWARNRWGKA